MATKSLPSVTELLRRKRQYEATGGTLTEGQTAGIVSGQLSAQAARSIAAENLSMDRELRERALSLQEQNLAQQGSQFEKSLAQRAEEFRQSQAMQGEYLDITKQGLEDQALAGYIQTGVQLAGTDFGQQVLGDLKSNIVNIGKKYLGGTTPAISGTVSGVGAAGIPLSTAAPYSIPGVEIPFAPSASVPALEAGAAGGMSVLGTLGAGGIAGGVAGTAGKMLTGYGTPGHMGGERNTAAAIGVAGGAAAGAAVAGPVGAIVGGVVGFATSSTVICTELHKHGYMTDKVYELDAKFGSMVDDDIYTGYRKLADPIVKKMQESDRFTKIVAYCAMPWVREMAHKIEPRNYKGSLVGKIIMNIGLPLCKFIGRLENGKLRKSVTAS